ncbi:pantoate--beta-alanine ligase [Sedimentitalea todarodis]|uniref:Pantothenate synthetase n=1 Tax=Sedimentitalea todarodis TaxID=1631240 RepID=A0ABU3VEF6_9RHOB|nr:pantoate--beta-alanine ligase [Sedimentitalea todarodis]MDU9004094.1 pantoate--beta-alanine ligase [Sedimentitalea todarodis]
MKIIRSKSDLREVTRGWRTAGETVGVVPTMGALHEGHLSLVSAACERADRVIVTLFVNPKQFNNPEDLSKYPRTEESDARKLAPFGVDVLYVPDGAEIYPDGFATTISVSGVSDGLCGATRPGHFEGVATVVAKLLLQTDADLAFFGEKDFQQVQVVRRMVEDLDLRCEIVSCPTVREASGLALSSRNKRLDDAGRQKASAIHASLTEAARTILAGHDVSDVLKNTRDTLLDQGLGPIDYLELRRESDLAPAEDTRIPARLFVAIWLGDVRLIDNLSVAHAG